MGVRIFTHERLKITTQPEELQVLIDDFRNYKVSGSTNGIFGSDVPYDRPSSVKFAELMHVHVRDKNSNPRLWDNIHVAQSRRVSNSALVYVSGSIDKDTYLLIAFFYLNAHEMARKMTFMCELAEIAERFRERF
ncbi:type II toxin-antitoxin system YafO family toxin [Aliikangiella sp. IMCC44359]|uniref:type II toxin-antitoxin system YafO family toxin n=1 Tax=Aliikangiella sp. IMCC44359 TaxID=3459125 RepID=UPI00403A8EE4